MASAVQALHCRFLSDPAVRRIRLLALSVWASFPHKPNKLPGLFCRLQFLHDAHCRISVTNRTPGTVCRQDNHATMDEQLAEEDLVDRLIERLHQIDPDTESMLNICKEKEKISARAIARALNKPQRTFADQIKRDRMELQKIR